MIITNSEKTKQIIISDNQWTYYDEILKYFDYYFNSVQSYDINGIQTIDFSRPYWHTVQGYDLHQVLFTTIAEPISTTQQYIDLLQIEQGNIVLDLGAYSGLSAILFKQHVGKTGRVISVEADVFNYTSCVQNVSKYYDVVGNDIELIHAAIWTDCNGLYFYSEGCMGSSKSLQRGLPLRVNSITISKLVELYDLDKIDAIKCDVEGAETVIFNDTNLYRKYKPNLIIELHSQAIRNEFDNLKNIGYTFTFHKQDGCQYPLLLGKFEK